MLISNNKYKTRKGEDVRVIHTGVADFLGHKFIGDNGKRYFSNGRISKYRMMQDDIRFVDYNKEKTEPPKIVCEYCGSETKPESYAKADFMRCVKCRALYSIK